MAEKERKGKEKMEIKLSVDKCMPCSCIPVMLVGSDSIMLAYYSVKEIIMIKQNLFRSEIHAWLYEFHYTNLKVLIIYCMKFDE